MNRSRSGAEFAKLLAGTLGQELDNAGLVAEMWDVCERERKTSAFNELAMYAKSFQKIAKLLSTDRLNEETRAKVSDELEACVTAFAALAENILSALPDDRKDELGINLILPTPGSYRNLKGLLNDFIRVKDFLLVERDGGLRD